MDDPGNAVLKRRSGRCQSKIDDFAQASESYFATVDFPGFFGIKPSGSTHFSSIQNFALTVPTAELRDRHRDGLRRADATVIVDIVATLTPIWGVALPILRIKIAKWSRDKA